jgi:hypothetical protein
MCVQAAGIQVLGHTCPLHICDSVDFFFYLNMIELLGIIFLLFSLMQERQVQSNIEMNRTKYSSIFCSKQMSLPK